MTSARGVKIGWATVWSGHRLYYYIPEVSSVRTGGVVSSWSIQRLTHGAMIRLDWTGQDCLSTRTWALWTHVGKSSTWTSLMSVGPRLGASATSSVTWLMTHHDWDCDYYSDVDDSESHCMCCKCPIGARLILRLRLRLRLMSKIQTSNFKHPSSNQAFRVWSRGLAWAQRLCRKALHTSRQNARHIP